MAPIAKTLQGPLEGVQFHDLDGKKYYMFLGIPYAKPPVGDLRFKEPQPISDSWGFPRAARKAGDACYNKNEFIQQYEGSEDCLYLNVFTRELPENDRYDLKPVMVYIHGGGFTMGSGDPAIYGPEYLVPEDVVLVTINYRLGFLGFLRLKDASLNVSGNMGLKDQTEALRWIKNNIQQFNGDPDNVTIFGQSAGAASVHYHILSPLSRDLFHKAILQSGSALEPWSDESDHNAVLLAKIRDPKITTEKEALELLKQLSVVDLLKLQEQYLATIPENSIRPIGLVIEPANKTHAFLTKRPIDVITSGEYNKVPMIIGYNNREGILVDYLQKRRDGGSKKLAIENYIPHNVNLKRNPSLKESFVEKLRKLYFAGIDEEDENIMLISDFLFVNGVIAAARNHAQTSAYPVYLYKFALDTKLNAIKSNMPLAHLFGCSHGDETGYLFKSTKSPLAVPGSIEDVSLRRVLRLWTNFAKFGNPTPDESFEVTWKPVMARQLNTLHIKEDLKMEVNPEGKRLDLWRQIYQQSPATAKYL